MNRSCRQTPPVRLLGEPVLRQMCQAVDLDKDTTFPQQAAQLHARLALFRAEHGFGRAISAPQIGVAKRFIAMHIEGESWTLVNPEIVWRSDARFRLWDDCMSFPDLLVRVSRHASISVDFRDPQGRTHSWRKLDSALAELLQHEIDHLDGILALDRADGVNALVARAVYEAHRDKLEASL